MIPMPERAIRGWRRRKKKKKKKKIISMTIISSYCRVCLLLQLSKVILVKLIVLLMP
jgi:hypothetical protein